MYYGTTLPGLKAELMLRGYDVEGKSDEQIIQIVLENGLPARRNNLNLEQHQTEHKDQDRKLDTAFRGTTIKPVMADNQGAGRWAGRNGVVFELVGQQSWNLNEVLVREKNRATLEQELSILAHVPKQQIKAYFKVKTSDKILYYRGDQPIYDKIELERFENPYFNESKK